ncbi:MAG: AAA family ATPase [Acetobacteraceae bacterium]
MTPEIAVVAALRARLWDAGYRPLGVLNWDHSVPREAGKKPLGLDWRNRALLDPPDAIRFPPVAHALNVGVLCDGLRVVDGDIDGPAVAAAVRALAIDILGEAPIRWRANSSRFLIPYRAAAGEPGHRVLPGKLGNIEVLGHGQQFVAYGRHKTGAELQWLPESLVDYSRDALPAVTEAQIDTFLAAAAPLIEADPPGPRANGHDPHAAHAEATADARDIAEVLAVIPNSGPKDWERFNRIGMASWAASGGSETGFVSFAAWSAKNPCHDIAACRERWEHYPKSQPDRIGAGTLFHMAMEARPGWRKPSAAADEPPAPEEGAYGAQEEPPAPRRAGAPTLRIINPADLDGVAVPERLWIVTDWLPIGCVTGQYGDGGVGKGMSAQELQTACATATPWFGLAVMRCPSIGFYSEDDIDELHRRQERICRAFGLRLSDLGDLRWISGVGEDNTFCTFDASGRMHVTDRFYHIEEAAKKHHARLVPLDNAADLFGGNENDRGQVRRFIGLLTRLGMGCSAAVLRNAHPSRAGLASGNLDGGNTAWHNSMRSRWGLAKPKGDDEPDDGERILTRHKANYAPDGGTIRLRWAGGVLVPVTRDGGITGMAARAAAEETFLLLLDRCEVQGVYVSESPHSSTFAPRVFARRPDRDHYTTREFERAMHALFDGRRIRVADYATKGRTYHRIAREQPDNRAAA